MKYEHIGNQVKNISGYSKIEKIFRDKGYINPEIGLNVSKLQNLDKTQ